MKETKIYCDHCGHVIDEMKDFADIEDFRFIGIPKTDLCNDCFVVLERLIKEYLVKIGGQVG